MRLAMHWEVDDSGIAGRVPTDGKLRVRDATEDERRCRQQIDAGHEPPSISQAENPMSLFQFVDTMRVPFYKCLEL